MREQERSEARMFSTVRYAKRESMIHITAVQRKTPGGVGLAGHQIDFPPYWTPILPAVGLKHSVRVGQTADACYTRIRSN